MVQPGIGLDTPRTNIGDATYLTYQPDFDISQEQSFQSPGKDNDNLIQQLQNGKRGAVNFKTPRSRVPLGDRRNLPALSAGEFTPLLKSATRNSARKLGKENGIPQTPGYLKTGTLKDIPEDTPLPHMSSSIYGDENRNGSYIDGTPVAHIESSSIASTPMALLPRRTDGTNVLQDGNQMSLREQENVIDKIEKENFGLKLKIHFLEEALRKAGPGFSEAALKENTELKVDKVTMQRELHRYRKTLTSAERDLEAYRQQMLEMQDNMRRKHVSEGQKEELDRLQRSLAEKESEVLDLAEQLRAAQREEAQVEKLQNEIGDLEADLREKDRLLDERDDEVDNLRETVKAAHRRELELEEKEQTNTGLAEAKETIEELERDINSLRAELRESRDDCEAAITERKRVEADLEELQEEMANKSITTKGLSRQIEEKANRLQDDLEELRGTHAQLEKQYRSKVQEIETLHKKIENFGSIEEELRRKTDERDLLQVRHDALTSESAGLQRDLTKARATIEDLEDKLDHEKTLALNSEREVRDQYKGEIDRLNDEIEDLRADIREKERVYDNDSDKWESDRRSLESQRDRAEEQAAGLQRTIDTLQQAEDNLSSTEVKLQQALETEKERHLREEAVLNRRVEELNVDIESRRRTLEDVQTELSLVREELRLSQREQKSLSEKVEALEDEVEVLQTSLDDETDRANADLSAARQESGSLRRELQSLKEGVDLQLSQGLTRESNSNSRLRETETQLTQIKKDKQELQDEIAKLNLEMHSLRTAAANTEAERDEIKSQLKELKQQEDTFRLDQEKIELRTSKMKLDTELRRIREEMKVLANTYQTTEAEMKQEIERANLEESRLKDEISKARKKETEYLQREAAQKEILRTLRRQITELERRAHDLEVSRLQSVSPHSSSSGSAHKSEIIEVRHQLATAHQSLKDLRAKLKEVERDSARKVLAAMNDLQAKTAAWETDKFNLERDLENALAAKEELQAKNVTAEQSITRLHSKIGRLEKELQIERQNAGEDRTMALERRDLHEMLRETQIQVEKLELVVKDRENTISRITAVESELRSQLKRVRDERCTQRERASKAVQQLDELETKFKRSREAWESEKRSLTRGVRFPNVSVSDLRANETLIREGAEREKTHVKELRGLAMQIEWLRAKCRREESLRADAAYAKRFMMLQIDLFGACNAMDLQLLQQMGITPDRTVRVTKPAFRTVAVVVRAAVRMRRGAEQWAKSRLIHDKLVTKLEVMRKKTRKSSGF